MHWSTLQLSHVSDHSSPSSAHPCLVCRDLMSKSQKHQCIAQKPASVQCAGLVAGLFGVGGGIVKVRDSLCVSPSRSAVQHCGASQQHLRRSCKGRRCVVQGPLMLEMGVLPDVAAATSATMMCASQIHPRPSPPHCPSLCSVVGLAWVCAACRQTSCTPNASCVATLHNMQFDAIIAVYAVEYDSHWDLPAAYSQLHLHLWSTFLLVVSQRTTRC